MKPSAKAVLQLGGDVLRTCSRKEEVLSHCVHGIPVFEGIMRPRAAAEFGGDLRQWCSAARTAFRRYCQSGGTPDLLHAHGRFLNAGAFAVGLWQSASIPYVYTEHSSFYQRGMAPSIAKEVVHRIVQDAAVYTAVSRAVGLAISDYLGFEVQRPEVTPNLLDEMFQQKEAVRPPAGPFVFLCVASLNSNKRVDLLLRSFARAFSGEENACLRICGDGALRGELESLAEGLGIRKTVHFLGHRSHPEVLNEMDRAHVVAVASDIETFGVVLIESFARGRPVVSTRCGGPEEIVNPQNGILVDRGDIEGMAEAMKMIVSDYANFNCVNIRRACVLEYGSQTFVNRMGAIYKKALDRDMRDTQLEFQALSA